MLSRLSSWLLVITLTWHVTTSPSSTAQRIFRQIGCTGAWVQRAQVNPAVTTWDDTATKKGTTYCYYVEAVFPKQVVSGHSNTTQATQT